MIGKIVLSLPLLFANFCLCQEEEVIHEQKPTIDWDSTNISAASVYAGMTQTLTEAYFRDYESRLIGAYSTKMESMEVEEYCSEQGFSSLFTTHLCIGKQTISSYSAEEAMSRLKINPAEKSLNLRLSGISLEFSFDFNVWSEPTWIKDKGTGTISVTGSDINLDLLPQNNKGILQVDYANAKIQTEDYSIELTGEADISRAVEHMLTNFKVFFEQELIEMLGSRLALATQEVLTEKLSLQTDQSTLLGDPIVENNFIAFVLDGSLESCDTDMEAYPRIPVHILDQNARVHSEQFVSQMTLASALQQLVQDNQGALEYAVSSDFLNKVVPNFRDVFGKHDDVVVRFELSSAPLLTVKSEGSQLSTDLVITVVNPYNSEYEAMIIYAAATAEIEFELLQDYDFTLIGHLQNEEVSLVDHKMLFYSEVNLEQLQDKVSLLTDLLMAHLNKLEEGGNGLTLGKPVDEEVSEARMFVYEGFIMVESVALREK